jgi:tetratricopeptide (TPR) repeat protein
LDQLISEESQSLFKSGDLRGAISAYRRLLRFEKDRFERARIYLELTRIYRIMVRMKNARLELLRAFACVGLRVPKNSLTSFVLSFFYRHNHLDPDFTKQSKVDQLSMLAILYEELGLSAYYLRQKLVLLQSIVLSRKPCDEAGISRPQLNWYGGSACVMALIGMRKFSLKLIKRCHRISEELKSPRDLGKALIWKALLYDYNGMPIRSAEMFRHCLDVYGHDLDPFDLRLAALTLSTNYFSRGHFEDALYPLKKMKTWNPCFNFVGKKVSWMDASFWYSLGPSVMLNKEEGVGTILSSFRSILSSDKDDKWLIAQYLGHLLTVERKISLPGFDLEEIVRRFRILEMKASETHFEASFYWISQAYLSFDHARKDPRHVEKFKASLANLKRTPPHPTNQSHYAVLRAGLALITKDIDGFHFWKEKGTELAQKIDNRWALNELQVMRELFNEK